MPVPNLQTVDDLIRPEYSFLDENDECFFFRERTSGEKYDYSETNQLISNFKIRPELRRTNRWYYKNQAIKKIAFEIRSLDLKGITVVPVPPSKCKNDPKYDDRLIQVLKKVPVSDFRELISLNYSLEASHQSTARTSIEELIDAYTINETLFEPIPDTLAIFDDVLTTGRHFKAIKTILQRYFPSSTIICGLFIARSIHKTGIGSILKNWTPF